jgi:hypothetical protein
MEVIGYNRQSSSISCGLFFSQMLTGNTLWDYSLELHVQKNSRVGVVSALYRYY